MHEAVDLADAVGQGQDGRVARERAVGEAAVRVDPAGGRTYSVSPDQTSPSGVCRSAMTLTGVAPAVANR